MAATGERATRETAREVGSSSAARLDTPTLADIGIPRDRAQQPLPATPATRSASDPMPTSGPGLRGSCASVGGFRKGAPELRDGAVP